MAVKIVKPTFCWLVGLSKASFQVFNRPHSRFHVHVYSHQIPFFNGVIQFQIVNWSFNGQVIDLIIFLAYTTFKYFFYIALFDKDEGRVKSLPTFRMFNEVCFDGDVHKYLTLFMIWYSIWVYHIKRILLNDHSMVTKGLYCCMFHIHFRMNNLIEYLITKQHFWRFKYVFFFLIF